MHPAQGVIIARGDADRISLAEKIVADLDKPKAEIVIDVLILSVSKDWTQNLGINLGLNGLTVSPTMAAANILLDKLPKLNTSDFAMSLPSATLSALLSTSGTKVLDKAELRMVEGERSSLRIGTKVPYATGSYQAAASGGGVNTQFQYFDVGLNMDIIAKVHEPDEVSLHIESDASSVNSTVDLGNGVNQPVIAQRKRVADVRVKEGEINFWDIVTQRQEVRSSSGVPGLSQIPGMGRFFRTDQITKTEDQVVTLLTPHIIRPPDIRSVNLLSVPSGSDQVVRMRYSGAERPAPPRDPNTPARTIELTPGTAPVTGNAVAVPAPGGAVASPGGAVTPPPGAPPGAPASPFGGGAPAAPVGGTAKASFNPDEVDVNTGANFDVQLILAGAVPLNEATVTVSFDAAIMKFVSAVAGGLAAGAETAPGNRPTEGILVLKNSSPVTGSGSLFKLTFQGLKPGDSTVAIRSFKATNAQSQSLPVQVEGLDVTIE